MAAKYDQLGIGYNQTRAADPYLTAQLFKHLDPQEGAIYLDIGCGTGNYTSALQEKGLQLIGIDPSERMLEQARAKNAAVDWRLGTAEQTGLETASVDGIVGSLTLHHWTDINAAFKELRRVVKPGGKLVLFLFAPEQVEGYWLNHYFPVMMAGSIQQTPILEAVEAALTAANFSIDAKIPYFIQAGLQDHILYCGKENPAYYFDPAIRRGISSFADLANADEVTAGLANLKKDMETGAVQAIMEQYANDKGDYLHLVAHAL